MMKTPEQLPRIPGFQIHRIIGEGASGTVWLATQESLGRDVAIKVLKTLPGSSSARHRFRREAQALAGVTHPRVMRVLGYQEADPCWMVLEYLPGGSLKERIREAGAGLEIQDVLRLAHDLLAAADALHGAQLVHRDIKPANVLYRSDGEAVLADFGLVSRLQSDDSQLTVQGQALGTLAYLAPEVVAGGEATLQADLFAIGVTLYEAATGRHPNGHLPVPAGFRAADPQAGRPALPAQFARLVRELIDPDPARRPGSAGAALARMRNAPDIDRRASRSGQRRAGVLSIATLMVAAAFWATARWPGAAPTVTVIADVDRATVLFHAALPDTLLCVFDGAGRLQAGALGVVEAAGTRFDVTGLQPGTDYQGQLVSRGLTRPPFGGRVGLRTATRVETLGVDPARPPGR